MYNIQMSANVEALNEVVVTALGIKREQKGSELQCTTGKIRPVDKCQGCKLY